MTGLRRVLALIALVFGLVTLVAGGRVLAGADPGYVVFRPLLLYNVAMGVVYIAAALIAWRNVESGARVAAGIFGLNLAVLLAIVWLHASGAAVALQSVLAMIVRTVVWLLLFIGLAWAVRGRASG